MQMSDGERLIAVMLAEIMEALKLDNEIDPKLVKSLVYSNEGWALRRKYPGLFDSEPRSDEVVEETGDILWMWGIVEHALGNLQGVQADEAKGWHYTSFHGFDGNNDPHYGVARMMIEELDEFGDMKGHALNSHSQATLPRYQRMYEKFMGYVNAEQAAPLSFDALKDICN